MFKGLFQERRRSLSVRGMTSPDFVKGPVLDRFVNAAASAFIAPLAALSLISDDEQIIKASHGVPIGCIPRAEGFCNFTLDYPDVLECCDPQGDPRFADLPSVVGEPHVRYYVGAPLRLLNGISVGALCVADTVSRQPASPDQKAYLQGLARQASMTLENRLNLWGNAA